MSSDDTHTLFRSPAGGARRPPRLLERGATIGRFVVLHSVGRGGSGEVYAAYDPQLERKVAIKLLHSGPDPDALVREAQVMARLRHPHVVTVYDLGESDGRLFLSMAYIEGSNLAEVVAKRRPDSAWAAEVGRQVASGLAAAHQAGILHRDLKPANVMVDGDGQALITDFGLAGLQRPPGGIEGGGLQAEIQAGTPAYMAPEQRAGAGVSAASDVYSLGWVLYELFTAEPPSRKRVLRPPPDQVPGLDPATETAVLRCLAVDPGERPTAAELAETLASALSEAARRVRVAFERARRRRRLLAAVAVAALLFAAAMSYQAHRIAQEARRARDVARLAVAGEWMAKDPTRAALVLLEIERPDEVVLARSKMRAALSRPLAVRELRGHRERIRAVEWSPEGRRIVTAALDRTAWIWQVDGSDHRALRHEETLWSARWSPDGRSVMTTTQNGTAYLWSADPSDGDPSPRDAPDRPYRRLDGHGGRIWRIVWSPAGRHLATASDDGTVRIWPFGDPAGDSHVPPLVLRHESAVFGARWDSAGRRLVTACYDGAARIWTLAEGGPPSGEPIVLASDSGIVFDAFFLPDDERVATAHQDGTVRIWSVAAAPEALVLRHHESSVYSVRLSPDGTLLLTGSLDGTARIWRADGSRTEPLLVLREHTGQVLAVSSRRRGLYVTSSQGAVRLWDLTTALSGDPSPEARDVHVSTLLGGHNALGVFDPDGERIATVSHGNTLRIWNADQTGKPRLLGQHDGRINSVAWSADGKRLVTGSDDGTARVWYAGAPAAGDPVRSPLVLRGHKANVYAAAWSPDGRRVVTAARDDTLRVWTPGSEEAPLILQGHRNSVRDAAWSPDGARIVSVSNDGTARLWQVAGSSAEGPPHRPSPILELVHETADHQPTYGSPVLTSVAWSNDGRRIAIGAADGTVRFWSERGERIAGTLEHDSMVTDVAWSRDGLRLATSHRDGAARIWSTDGQLLWTLAGHDGEVSTVAFDARGERAVTASWDGTVRVWPLATGGAAPMVIEGPGGPVSAAAFSPGGERLVIASADGAVQVWRLDSVDVAAALRAATQVCLTPDFRRKHLGEAAGEARRRYEACERSHGRVPPAEPAV